MEFDFRAESFRILRTLFEFADNADGVACAQQDPEDMEYEGRRAVRNKSNQSSYITGDNRRLTNTLKEDVPFC